MNSEERRSRRRELYRLRRERETTEEREERLARQRDIDVLVKRNNKEKETNSEEDKISMFLIQVDIQPSKK